MKTMAKIEVRAVWAMLIYFLVLACHTASRIPSLVNDLTKLHLQSGLSTVMDRYHYIISQPTSLFKDYILGFMGLTILGVLLLIYLSFRNDSHQETGRFLKSLPFKNEERYFIKIGVGLAVITIPYIIFTILMVMVRHYYLSEMKSIYELTLLNDIYKQLLPLSNILQLLCLAYLLIILVYLIGVLFEYLISNNILSIIIGMLISFSPLFITESLSSCFRVNLFYSLEDIVWRFYRYLLPNTLSISCYTGENATEYYALGSTEYVVLFGERCILFLILIALCTVATLYFCKKNVIENDDILMPYRWFRILFVVGVTLCSALLCSDFYLAFYNNSQLLMMLWFIIGGTIGFVIAYLISRKGLRKFEGATK